MRGRGEREEEGEEEGEDESEKREGGEDDYE